MINKQTNKQTNNNIKLKIQKGFTFVELLVIMVIIAIIGGIGIQFVLSTQEDKAKLTNARTFFAKDFPNAVLSCLVRKNEVTDCVNKRQLLRDDIDPLTEWGDSWSVVSPLAETADGILLAGIDNVTARVATRSIVLCYPMEEVAIEDRQSLEDDIIEYMDDETSWTFAGSNNQGKGFITGADASNDIRQNSVTGPIAALNSGAAAGTTIGGVVPDICNRSTDVDNFSAAAQDLNNNINGGSPTLGGSNGRYIQMMYVIRRP